MSTIVLIIEDDQMIQKLLTRMIKRSGFGGEVVVFSESGPALEYLEQNAERTSAALLDTMIHPQGDEALAFALLERAPHLKLVASSGHSEEDLRGPTHFGSAPLFGVLSKPFGLTDIKQLFALLDLIT